MNLRAFEAIEVTAPRTTMATRNPEPIHFMVLGSDSWDSGVAVQGRPSPRFPYAASASANENVVPDPTSLSADNVVPCNSRIRLAMASPSPAPPFVSLAR